MKQLKKSMKIYANCKKKYQIIKNLTPSKFFKMKLVKNVNIFKTK